MQSPTTRRRTWWPLVVLLALFALVAYTILNAAGVLGTYSASTQAQVHAAPDAEAGSAENGAAGEGAAGEGAAGAGGDAPGTVIQVVAPVPTALPDLATLVPQIEVSLPPPPPPPPPASSGGKGKKGNSSSPSQVAASGGTYAQWCDGGGGSSASASTLDGLLAAANAERARWGFGALSWSSSLASVAQGWSESMAAAYDPGSPGTAMTHNPHRPSGGENVGVSWTTGGSMSQGSALSRMQSGWMTSAGHCKNILNPKWTVMGAGAAQSSDGRAWYATVNFQ